MLSSRTRIGPERLIDPAVAQPLGRYAKPDLSWCRRYASALALLDSLAVVIGAVVALWLRFGGLGALAPGRLGLPYAVVAFAFAPVWVLTMTFGGTYDRRYFGWGTEEFRRVFDAAVRFLLLLALVGFLLKIDMARGFVAIAIPLATVLTLLGRYGARRWMYRMRRHGRFTKRVVVVGSAAASSDLVRQLHSAASGLSVVGVCAGDAEHTIDVDGRPVRVLGQPSAALEAVVASQADVIAIADTASLSNGSLRRLAWRLEGTGVEIMVTPALTDVAGPRISVHPLSDIPLLLVEEPELKGSKRVAKGVFDRMLAAFGLIFLFPVLLLIGVLVRLTSRGPALFKQVRVGLGGRHFVMWKFRTMDADAEDRLPDLTHLNEHDGALFKIRDDPRITPFGRFLRRWSLDELPQLWNVVRGDMSVVGPRPPLPREVERYDHHVRRRLLVKPGLTGLWQVGGRAGVPWDEAVRLDLYYVENWSLSMDAVILGKTVTAVLRGQGAY
jgi:exopolysaccharide biosynthesis polyprenyl glycosylphosphotransferase